jgi:large subunit ribosomal protein L24
MNRLRVGDQVVVISGKEKGKTGRVARIFQEEDRVIVEGLNIVKRHTRPGPMNQEGGIIEKEAPLHASKVMPLDPQTGKPTRVKIKVVDGKKVRTAKSGAVLSSEEKLWPKSRTCLASRRATTATWPPRSRRSSTTRTRCRCPASRRSW